MDRWVEEIEGWEVRPVAAGFDGLRSLAADSFSGAVSAGDAWLFMVNGRGVGVFEYAAETAAAAPTVSRGSLDALDGADLTAHVAPHHSIPLLIAMQAGETTTRARYYTEDTPIPEVHETLTDGGFTGYLELSENVLSGDYYVVYQAGRSAEVAFIGNSRQVETDEDAFERACDEVGIYEVVAASIEPVDLPEPEPDRTTGTAGTTGTAAAAGIGGTDGEEGDDDADATASGRSEGVDASGGEASDVGEATDDPGPGTAGSTGSGDRPSATDTSTAGGTGTGGSSAVDDDSGTAGSGSSPERRDAAARTGEDEGASSDTLEPLGSLDDLGLGDASDSADDAGPAGEDDGSGEADAGGADAAGSAGGPDAGSGAGVEPGAESGADADTDAEVGDDDTTASADASPHGDLVPAITEVGDGAAEPEVTATDPGDVDEAEEATAEATGTGAAAGSSASDGDEPDGPDGPDRPDEPDGPEGSTAAAAGAAGSGVGAGEAAALRDRLAKREEELDAVRRERDELAARVSELEAAVEQLRDGGGAGAASGTATAGEALSAADALAGTNLFVRYRSKGAATLSDAAGGDATREELADNLRIEHHTGFEAAEATVDGQPFESWLTDTHQFRFLRWLVTSLPFEIRETGSQEALRELYGALPEIDRVELDGTVATGEETGEAFDLVALDQMGDPLLVARIDPDREPIAEMGVADLVGSATSVAETHPDLAAAFHVTEAFFQPRAMETAREATSGSLLSRDSRRSFVKISRNRGYHLCLVEARDDSYYLSVPDL
ncbi:MAG: hypothetical protein ABEI11_02015 [Haloarculaceae archaeon]